MPPFNAFKRAREFWNRSKGSPMPQMISRFRSFSFAKSSARLGMLVFVAAMAVVLVSSALTGVNAQQAPATGDQPAAQQPAPGQSSPPAPAPEAQPNAQAPSAQPPTTDQAPQAAPAPAAETAPAPPAAPAEN